MPLRRAAFAPFLSLLLFANTNGQRDYALDSSASEVKAKVAFLGLASKSMRFPKMSGTVRITPGALDQAEIDVIFDATAMEAPDETTLRRLRSEKFFWVERYPTVRFAGRSLAMSSRTEGTLTGELTARGVSVPQVLDVVFDEDPLLASPTRAIGFTATTRIDRRKYGMKSYQLLVGNKVNITMRARMVPN